jgi:hypothetical protein
MDLTVYTLIGIAFLIMAILLIKGVMTDAKNSQQLMKSRILHEVRKKRKEIERKNREAPDSWDNTS